MAMAEIENITNTIAHVSLETRIADLDRNLASSTLARIGSRVAALIGFQSLLERRIKDQREIDAKSAETIGSVLQLMDTEASDIAALSRRLNFLIGGPLSLKDELIVRGIIEE